MLSLCIISQLFFPVCRQRPLELVFIIDASASIWWQNFTKAKNFVDNFIGQYEIGPDKVRIGLVTYGNFVYFMDVIRLSKYEDLRTLQHAVQKLPYRAGHSTRTGNAIKYVRTSLFAESRKGVRKVAVVMTDGNSRFPTRTAKQAHIARYDDIEMYCIGVSDQVSHKELVNIAGEESNVFYVTKYSELEKVKGRLAMKTCTKVGKFITNLSSLPYTRPCGSQNPADVYFVFDPAALGTSKTDWVARFIRRSINTGDMEHMQFGILSGSCPIDAGFDLDRYDNIEDIENHLAKLTTPRIPGLMEDVIANGYSVERGGRPDCRNVTLMFVGNRIKDASEIVKAARKARDSGIELYFANVGDATERLMNRLDQFGKRLDHSKSLILQVSQFLSGLCSK
ncbi:hypothetical protein LOTGIDRAFT_134745 [Lottia gigantea]|uniref:VWFA domain-containing protein n=1 Tax=Lottia gigantea TaxID=225164 RepID=V3ZNH4_LOTGI|nr:hypothetical protein LOTGIDRAFT_134745 [Lottia gigantea]ESO82396.1 hypothetical protein LOTGIDRAFT_134745 [Lottia gigantea]